MPIKKSFSEVALSKESLTSRRSDKLAFRQGSVRQMSDKRRLMGFPVLPSKGYKYMMTMQLIVLYILWRFTKAILVGWSKDSHYRDRWTVPVLVSFAGVTLLILGRQLYSCPYLWGRNVKNEKFSAKSFSSSFFAVPLQHLFQDFN